MWLHDICDEFCIRKRVCKNGGGQSRRFFVGTLVAVQLKLSRMGVQRDQVIKIAPISCFRPIRLQFCQWLIKFAKYMTSLLLITPFLVVKSDFINSQTYKVWSTKNLQAYRKRRLHHTKIGVWCAISRKRIVGPIFFYGIINSEVYCFIIQQFVALLLPKEHYCWFEQNGARCHTSIIFRYTPRSIPELK